MDSQSAPLCSSPLPLDALATEVLRGSPYRSVRQVTCTMRGNVLTLTGSVPSFFHKQVAQSELLVRWGETAIIDNRLQVIQR
ncbi:MAG TPA: hypothetical protein VMF30_17170 [Pirellulales bacterium]|nr:hypothetical protein [Pirellulales bacterium]